MSREIKFRGKRLDDGRWVYGHLFQTPLTAENFDASFFVGPKSRWCVASENGTVFAIDIQTVGEFTSLRDKTGREIYEGDIVRLHGEEALSNEVISTEEDWTLTGKVRFDLGAFAWLVGIDHEYITFWEIATDDIDIEVIGNVHSNPELLEVKP